MRTAFSFYGGKGMLSSKYPPPKYKTIVEPFAGGAAYSLKYYNHDCILIEKNKDVCAVWEYIKNPNKKELEKIPQHITPGMKVSDFKIDNPAFINILRFAANVGTGGTKKKMETITKIGAKHFYKNTVQKILFWTDKIKHWQIYNGDYFDFDFGEASYFIDPPYQNQAGTLYKYGSKVIDYTNLKKYISTLKGQIIICENSESEWIKDYEINNLNRSCNVKAKHINKNRQSEVFIEIINRGG